MDYQFDDADHWKEMIGVLMQRLSDAVAFNYDEAEIRKRQDALNNTIKDFNNWAKNRR